MSDNPAFDCSEKEKSQEYVETSKEKAEGLEMKRKVGLFSGVALIVGQMIGSGIFISPGGVLQRSGSVGLSLVMWAACGILAIFGSLSYAELGTLVPKSGAEYAYFMDGLAYIHPFWGPLTAFLYSWIMILLLRPTSFAAGCLSISSYTVYPILNALDLRLCSVESEEMVVKIVAILYLVIIMALNSTSVDWTIRIGNTFTVGKLVAIGILVGCGVYQLYLGETQHLAKGFEGSTTDFGKLAMAFYGGLWAYDGWNNLNYVTEELKNPYVTLPRSIIIGIPLVTFCYLAVNVAYLTVLSPEEMIRSSAVAVDIGNRLLGPMAFIIPLSVTMSTFGSVLSGGFSVGRLCFASAREGHLVEVLSHIHVEYLTPVPALLFSGGLSVIFILAKDVAALIDFFTFVMWIFYVLAMVLVLILRKTKPNAYRPYKVPLFIPITVIIVGSFLVVAPIISDPSYEYLYVLAAIFAGFLVYIPFVYYKYSFSFIGSLTRIVQLSLRVGPTVKPIED